MDLKVAITDLRVARLVVESQCHAFHRSIDSWSNLGAARQAHAYHTEGGQDAPLHQGDLRYVVNVGHCKRLARTGFGKSPERKSSGSPTVGYGRNVRYQAHRVKEYSFNEKHERIMNNDFPLSNEVFANWQAT